MYDIANSPIFSARSFTFIDFYVFCVSQRISISLPHLWLFFPFHQGLREMLSIANRSGSIQPATTAVDAETQTDHDLLKAEEDREEEDETPTQADSSNLNTTQIEQKSAETEGTSASW